MANLALRSATAARARLASSPTFAMSLGAKELFHTNTIAFLLETTDPAAVLLQHELRAVLGLPWLADRNEVSHCAVWREYSHLDLVIVPLVKVGDVLALSRDRCLVVEAKLKAVPGVDQLERYSARTEPLSLQREGLGPLVKFWLRQPAIRPSTGRLAFPSAQLALLCFDDGMVLHSEWRHVTWASVASALVAKAALMPAVGRLQPIVADYGDTLTDIVNIVVFARQLVASGIAEGWPYAQFHAALTDTDWSSLRLSDLIGKVAFGAWAARLREKIASTVTQDGQPVNVLLEPFLTHGKPGISVDVPYRDLVLGVQVQGLDFRHFVKSAIPRPDLERGVVESPLFSSWLRIEAFGRPFRGTRRGAVGPLVTTSPGDLDSARLSNLGIFKADKFLHSSVTLNDVSLEDVERQILAGILLATELARRNG